MIYEYDISDANCPLLNYRLHVEPINKSLMYQWRTWTSIITGKTCSTTKELVPNQGEFMKAYVIHCMLGKKLVLPYTLSQTDDLRIAYNLWASELLPNNPPNDTKPLRIVDGVPLQDIIGGIDFFKFDPKLNMELQAQLYPNGRGRSKSITIDIDPVDIEEDN
jgi:hypothetical protein